MEILGLNQKHTKGILTGSTRFVETWSLIAVTLTFLAALIWPHQAVALSSAPNSSTWITDGTVYAIVDNGTTVYIGGDFTYVGPNTGFGAPIIASSGSLAPTYPKVNGIVNVAVSDGSNGWYIGGDFTRVGSYERNRVAHIFSDGTVDAAWNPNADSVVYTLAVSGTMVYAGGEFTSIGGQPRQYIAALDATGAATAWAPQANNTVWALAVSGATVYAGGDFTSIGAALRNFVAALDATGSATSWNPNADDAVYALAVNGGTVYAGGMFTTIGGQSRQHIAALDATGSATAWNPNADAPIFALKVNGTLVYAAGDFSTIGAQSPQPTRNFIAALNAGDTGTATTWNPNADNTVWALDVSGTTVYAGGDFTNIGGLARNHIAALNATDDGTATTWNPNANDTVYAAAVSGTQVYVGGLFTSIGGQARNNLAALNATTGEATVWDPNANRPVYALALIGTKLYVGGEFTTMGGNSRLRIARFTTTTGALDSYTRNFDSTILVIKVIGSNLYFGGDFTVISGNSLPYLASFDSGGIIRTTWMPNPSAPVLALAWSGDTIYVGGYFGSIGSQEPQPTRNYLAAVSATDGTASSWNPNPSDAVWALDVSGTTVYVGGQFNFIGAQEEWPYRNYIAALNTTDNGTATNWDPNASDPVWALAVGGNTVYAGGDFTTIGAQFLQPIRNHLAALKATDNGTATNWDPNLNNFTGDSTVHALALGPSRLHVGGYFSTVGDVSQPFLARFDGNTVVDFKSFTAKGSANHVSLCWETGAEVDNAGFRLWRSIVSDQGYKLITPHMIPAEGDAENGAEYDYQDRNVRPGMTYYYRLEAIDIEGGSAFYDPQAPVSATVGSIVLTFPRDGASIPEKMPPSLKWRSRGFDRFQIQFSGDAKFGSTVTIPNPAAGKHGLQADQWITEEAYRLSSTEWRTIIAKLKVTKEKPLFWRVYGDNNASQGVTSEANRIVVK